MLVALKLKFVGIRFFTSVVCNKSPWKQYHLVEVCCALL